MIEGNLTITMASRTKRELNRHERFYNALLLVMSVLAFVSVVAMSAVGTIGTGMYFWIVFVLVLGYWSYRR